MTLPSGFSPLLAFLLALVLAAPSSAAAAAAATQPDGKTSGRPAPTLANVRYGDHERHVLDFWQAKSARPTPVLFFIHGGGWVRADKSIVPGVPAYLAAGISVVSINYRYIQHALAAGVTPPVQWPLHDAARALQFVRSKAKEWNIDKERIGASGGSAGACSSLWLAFYPDMADPQNSDPIARESTRFWCAAVNGAQTTLDPKQMFEWTPNSRYGGHAFGFWPEANLPESGTGTRDAHFAEFLAARERILPWIMKYSPMAHVTADDPPVYLHYSKEPPAIGQAQKDPTHSPNFGVKLREKLREVGVECDLVYPGATDVRFPSAQEYLIDRLLRPTRSAAVAVPPPQVKIENIRRVFHNGDHNAFTDLVRCAELPSGGDNSYPGFVELDDGRGLLSWYSTHEKYAAGEPITAIYLAELAAVK